MNQIMKTANFKQARMKNFIPHNLCEGKAKDLNVFQAFFNTNKAINGSIYLNVNPCIKFFQTETLADIFYKMKDDQRIKEEYIGKSVMTTYNHRIYTISDICFNMDPSHTFHVQSKGQDVSYAEYLKEQYGVKIHYPDQPMIKCHIKRTNQDIFLVPEVCVGTGITETQKRAYRREIEPLMFSSAQGKADQCSNFFRAIKNAPNYENVIE